MESVSLHGRKEALEGAEGLAGVCAHDSFLETTPRNAFTGLLAVFGARNDAHGSSYGYQLAHAEPGVGIGRGWGRQERAQASVGAGRCVTTVVLVGGHTSSVRPGRAGSEGGTGFLAFAATGVMTSAPCFEVRNGRSFAVHQSALSMPAANVRVAAVLGCRGHATRTHEGAGALLLTERGVFAVGIRSYCARIPDEGTPAQGLAVRARAAAGLSHHTAPGLTVPLTSTGIPTVR